MSAEAEAGETPVQRASVLVATSDSATRDLLRRILHVGAVEVVDASDGLEALALARRLDLDLIVLDAFLAVMDGITVCGRIRALTDIEQPPIIIVGLISERAVEVALSAGADESLPKPINPALIRSRTRALLTRRQVERQLGLMARALAASSAAISILDARSSEYTVVFANAAFFELTGYASDEILGHNLRLLTGPDTDVAAMTALRDEMAAGRGSRVLLKNYRKDGRPFWNDLATSAVVDAAGRLTHFIAVQHDVTSLLETPEHETARAIEDAVAARTQELDSALGRVEARRRFTETILNSMVSAIIATDTRGIITFANLAALQTLGSSLADCVGRPVVELFAHHEGVSEVIRGAVPAHVEHRLDFSMISPGGARFYVGMSITPAPPELRDEIGFIFLFRNLAETVDDGAQNRARAPLAERKGPANAAGRGASADGHDASPDDATPVDGLRAISRRKAAPTDGSGPADAGETPTPARRVLLALRYCSPAELVRRAVDALAAGQGSDGSSVEIEAAEDLPEVLVDRQQVGEALEALLAATLERCGDPSKVKVRISRTETAAERSGQPAAQAARIDVLSPRALITEGDLFGPSEAKAKDRQSYRRADLSTAEKLLEANGGRLLTPAREDEEQNLVVVLRAASRPS